ncbi:hypothetical protein GGF31_002235 [Allomyces arbusculus]|nr:hypothetical protein GGF31_002235 [Allomyces arbusculus]
MAQISNYALDVSIKMDTIRVTATVDSDQSVLYSGLIADLSSDQKEAIVSLFTMNDYDDTDKADEAKGTANALPREATFHAKFSAPGGVPLDVAGFVKAVLNYCGDDNESDEKDAPATRDAPDMAGMPPRGRMPGMWGRGGMRGQGGFRGMWRMWGGHGGMAGGMGRGGMGPGEMGPGGMGPGGMGGMPGVPHGFPGHPGHQGPFGEHGPHQGLFGAHGSHGPHGGSHGMPFGPGAPWGGARRMPGQWQYQGKSKHGAIALTMDIREL